ncbi:MAG TPA: hypothetical protein IAC41_12870 [Candidatus Merdenecus merdavium]|nr:hypothetical protein [Candidatus Merdenecus merdavium]
MQEQSIQGIKLAAGSVQYKKIPIQNTIIEAVSCSYSYFKDMGTLNYLEVAILHIQAYLKLGFSYEKRAGVFDKVL